jgi:hypothetical protein
MLGSRQREMRPEWPPLELEPQGLARQLDIVMQQLKSRIVFHAHPYDSSLPKVREGTNATKIQEQLAMPTGGVRDRGGEVLDPILRDIAQELERQVNVRIANPTDLGHALPKRRRRGDDFETDVVRDVDREKEPHAPGF